MAVVLASKSPRRRELMALVTPDFDVCDAHVDESAIKGTTPAGTAAALADAKALAAYDVKKGRATVIGCDTVVELEGDELGKPKNEAQALEMLAALAGRAHRVHTGITILPAGGGEARRFTETTVVHMAPIPAADIATVAATPEPYDKAGGYGIQGWAAHHIPRIEGCYYNVMGLPVAALYRVLKEMDQL